MLNNDTLMHGTAKVIRREHLTDALAQVAELAEGSDLETLAQTIVELENTYNTLKDKEI